MHPSIRVSALLTLLLLLGIALSSASVARGNTLTAVTVPTAAFAEGNDFATRVLGDPWDMSNYADISHALNESGQRRLVNNPTMANGAFSGSSFNDANNGDGNPYIFPLYPGYTGDGSPDPVAVPLTDRIGYNYPITSATNHCLYIALNTQSPPPNAFGPDVMRIFWFADHTLNTTPALFGMTYVQLYPEPGTPTPRWQVIKVDLSAAGTPLAAGGTRWENRAQWQGLRIDTTAIAAGTPFAVDWVRLTDCAAVNQTITWTPNASVNAIWLQPVGVTPTRNIRLVTGVNGSSGTASVDFQGVAAGSYYVGVGTTTTCCSEMSTQAITINQAPAGQFVTPSYTSGLDYATQVGNPWDFDLGITDGTVASLTPGAPAASAAYTSDGLLVTTPPGPLPAGSDVVIYMNTPQAIDPNVYRYLTIDMETSWLAPWENIPDGMIGRWIWSIQGVSGIPGYRCNIVSPDIPYDIGRQQITIDLFSLKSGTAEAWQGDCPPVGTPTWRTGPVLATRFDPNENVTGVADPTTGGGPFTQRIRSIQLTKTPAVSKAGGSYNIALGLSEDPTALTTTFYYTTSTAAPTQHLAIATPAVSGLPNKIFVPQVQRSGIAPLTSRYMSFFSWDLTSVTAGSYYICAVINDGLNSQTTCSKVPITVQ